MASEGGKVENWDSRLFQEQQQIDFIIIGVMSTEGYNILFFLLLHMLEILN